MGALSRALSQDLVRQVVVYLGIVVKHLEVCILQQLLLAFVKQLVNGRPDSES